jgi:hypothetical protein
METTENSLQESVAEIVLEEVTEELESAWKGLWHNASITFPDQLDDDECEEFWERLSDHTRMVIEFLEESIYEEFKERLTLYTYGRSGATIAPDELMTRHSAHGYGSYGDRWDNGGDAVEQLEVACEDLAIIQFIDKAVRAEAAYIPEWWKEELENAA